MTDPSVTICFIHGVTIGPPEDSTAWASVLEESMALNGQPRPSDRDVEMRTIDYRHIFRTSFERIPMPERTDSGLDKAAREQARAVYEIRRELVAQSIHDHIPKAPRSGWAGAPNSATAIATDAVAFLLTPLREQARRYAVDDKLRAAVVTNVLEQLPDEGRVVLVAHSLGSVVALDVIPRMKPGADVSLVTIGSPLPLKSWWGHVKLREDQFPLDRMRSWVNVFDASDPITAGRGVAARFPDAIDVQVSFGALAAFVANHVSDYYLSLPIVAATVAEAAFDLTAPIDTLTIEPSTGLGPEWNVALFAGAYAAQIARTTDEKKHAWRTRFNAARRISVERVLEQARRQRRDLPTTAQVIPQTSDLLDNAASHVRGQWADDQIVPLAVGLLMASPVHPFEVAVAPDHAQKALTQTLNRVRSSDSQLSDQEFARAITESLTEAARAVLPRGRRFGPYLLIAGAAMLAATGVGLWAAAPAGLAGAAALTSMLAAFGPGGMVGGMMTLALGSSIGSALMATGAADATKGAPGRRLDAVRFVEDIARMSTEQITASVIGWLACVRTQRRLDFDSWAEQIRALLQRVLVEVENERNVHGEIESTRESEWESKSKVVRKALEWLDDNYPPALVDEVRLALGKGSGNLTPSITAIKARVDAEIQQTTKPRTLTHDGAPPELS